ncbi:uncharacterized protein F5Z01DRAFT_663045 [Emericellopsis atlantica]|uniref:Glycosyltransferase family 28 N-terminal domain-containing protein n=1 Tax=Emericellopsis atlantica TaxID=2614577 RepID=A0A9P7ZH94_9HYPO|nr:uncharacterized protein F5Z01DRAFT_663045 [Emericellopsis atlantica]KAG9251540.1 hypothetical protein F5Z01DRAFT_663045 [Emericellopsis atlantica]
MMRHRGDPDHGKIHLETIPVDRPDEHRQSATVLRDEEGHLAFPGFVPTSTTSPEIIEGRDSLLSKPENGDTLKEDGTRQGEVSRANGRAVGYGDYDDDEDTADDELAPPPAPRKSSTMPARLDKSKSATPGHRQLAVPVMSRVKSSGSAGRAGGAPTRPSAPRDWQTDINRRGSRAQAPYTPPAIRRAGTSYLNTAIWSRTEEEYVSSSSSSSDDDGGDDEEAAATATTRAERGAKAKRGNQTSNRKDNLLGGADADDRYRKFLVGNENYQSKGKVKKDGRLRITVNETAGTGYIAKALGAAISKMKPPKEGDALTSRIKSPDTRLSPASSFTTEDLSPRPKLNIVIMVIGSRGDVQPFLKIGKVLKEEYGHRVRLATHPAFREYVERDSGLEFFSVGGDPSELMAFMVKNPGMIPSLETVRAGDIGKRRTAMAEMFDGFWRACVNATDDEKDKQNLKMMGTREPFVADAIIANPPSFAHVHCAEALGIPLHLMFTFPYTPTQAFPHPLASIKKSNVDPGYTNFISYPMVEMMVWQGLGDLINDFRVKTLALDPVSTLWAPGATYRLHVPFTYMWSPGLVPKPRDWGNHIDISGFVYLDLASSFKPPKDLEEFLAAGEEPIYIGFGSIVVDDADRFTEMIFEAVEKAGVRALVSRGWGGLGSKNTPDNIFMLENTPHDWLFPKIKACVIHGGAGTTAIALKLGKPTMVVPFFGDQHFWGSMISNAKVGPEPVPYKSLTADTLAEGIKYCLTDEARMAAEEIARNIEAEGDGAHNAVRAFHRHLNLRGPRTMRCSIFRDRIAAWQPKHTDVKLSPLAADMLVDAGFTKWKNLRLIRHQEWNDFEGPGEPVTGIAGSLTHTFGNAAKGVGSVPVRLARTSKRYRKRQDRKREKKRLAAQHEEENAQIAAQQDASRENLDTALQRSRTATTNELHGEFVDDVTEGVGLTATALAMAPVDLALALAQGFHNAPRLYGDDTVRKPIRITGIRSGLRAARKEFVYGVYDGWTGLVRLPYRGAKSRGVVGVIKGTGMGLMGLVLKNTAAIVGPWGYTLKGLAQQAKRTKSPSKFIRRARIIQGQREAQTLDPAGRKRLEKDVVTAYNVYRDLCGAIAHEERQRGLAGQLDRVLLDTGMLFEDMDIAKRALGALKRGESLESVIHPPTEDEMRESRRSSGKKVFSWGRDRSRSNAPGRQRAKSLKKDDKDKGKKQDIMPQRCEWNQD